MNAPLIRLEGLCVDFDGAPAVGGIDLEVRPAEILGLVGESGSGKSVTWLAVLGLLPGRAQVRGRAMMDGQNLLALPVAAIERVRGGRIGLISQDPTSALNPVLTVRRQLAETLTLHRGLSGRAIEAEALRLLDLVGIPAPRRRLASYPHELSGGQNQRVMIAMALAGQPDLLIADEPTTALDVTIQAQILDLLTDLRRELNMAIVLISHDLGVIAQTCDRVAVMYAGRLVETAPADALFAAPRHPYSVGLLAALPTLEGAGRLAPIPGTVPDPRALPPGCSFAPRCAHALPACTSAPPALRPLAPRHSAACIRADSLTHTPAPAAARQQREFA